MKNENKMNETSFVSSSLGEQMIRDRNESATGLVSARSENKGREQSSFTLAYHAVHKHASDNAYKYVGHGQKSRERDETLVQFFFSFLSFFFLEAFNFPGLPLPL